jgi:hypothetical protein
MAVSCKNFCRESHRCCAFETITVIQERFGVAHMWRVVTCDRWEFCHFDGGGGGAPSPKPQALPLFFIDSGAFTVVTSFRIDM